MSGARRRPIDITLGGPQLTRPISALSDGEAKRCSPIKTDHSMPTITHPVRIINTSHRDQRAFILNCDQHWITLRRFGNSEGSGPWFNLNSSLDRPNWISETYLGLWLQQAEADGNTSHVAFFRYENGAYFLALGYSTFVVVPTNPDNPLPQTDADVIAVSLPPRTSSEPLHPPAPYSPHSSAGLEDEDLELQAALQASLGGAAVRIPMPHPRVGPVTGGTRAISPVPGPNIGFTTSPPLSPPPPVPHPSTRPVNQPMENPVAASMARNQVVLERMRREQEAALREHYHDEVSRFGQMPTGSMSRSGIGSRVDEEEEQMRRAIELSEAMARDKGLELGRAETGRDDSRTSARSDTQQAEPLRPDRIHGGRVYDDEDAELQAALQASLETAPPGIHTPTPPRTFGSPMRRSPLPAAASRAAPRPSVEPSTDRNAHHDDGDDDDDDLYYDDEDTATEETLSDSAAEPQQADDVSVEEMRRRRLARFGGGPQT